MHLCITMMKIFATFLLALAVTVANNADDAERQVDKCMCIQWKELGDASQHQHQRFLLGKTHEYLYFRCAAIQERLREAVQACAGECPNNGRPENLVAAAEVIRGCSRNNY